MQWTKKQAAHPTSPRRKKNKYTLVFPERTRSVHIGIVHSQMYKNLHSNFWIVYLFRIQGKNIKIQKWNIIDTTWTRSLYTAPHNRKKKKNFRRHHGDIAKTSLRHHTDKTKTRQKITKASLWHFGDIMEALPKRHWNLTDRHPRQSLPTGQRHFHDTTKTTPRRRPNTKLRRNQHRNITMTPQTSPKQVKCKTAHHPRHNWGHEFFQPWSFLRRQKGHSHTGLPKGAQYTNSKWNFRFCKETRSKFSSIFIIKLPKHHHQSKNSTSTSMKQHRAITHSSSKDHSTIINTHPRNFTKTYPRRHDRDITKTTPKQHRGITQKKPRHDPEDEFLHLEAFSATYGSQLHWFAQRYTIFLIQIGIWDFA